MFRSVFLYILSIPWVPLAIYNLIAFMHSLENLHNIKVFLLTNISSFNFHIFIEWTIIPNHLGSSNNLERSPSRNLEVSEHQMVKPEQIFMIQSLLYNYIACDCKSHVNA